MRKLALLLLFLVLPACSDSVSGPGEEPDPPEAGPPAQGSLYYPPDSTFAWGTIGEPYPLIQPDGTPTVADSAGHPLTFDFRFPFGGPFYTEPAPSGGDRIVRAELRGCTIFEVWSKGERIAQGKMLDGGEDPPEEYIMGFHHNLTKITCADLGDRRD